MQTSAKLDKSHKMELIRIAIAQISFHFHHV